MTASSELLLVPGANIKSDVTIAKTAPVVDFFVIPNQSDDHPGSPWSIWGDCLAINGKMYFSIGDHRALGGNKGDLVNSGNAYVHEYDPATRSVRLVADCKKILNLPQGHYTPGKIHGRLDMDKDGWLYFSTHRGSTGVTRDEFHYKGDWIIRVKPATGESEVLACGPVPKHCIPCSVLDPDRGIFYGGTAAGQAEAEDSKVDFFAFEVKSRKVLYSGPNGPGRYMIFARSTGKVYYVATQPPPPRQKGPKAKAATQEVPPSARMIGPLMCYDPAKPSQAPVQTKAVLGLRAATQETPQGIVYTVSNGQNGPTVLYAFDTKTEQVEELGDPLVGSQRYIASIDADPTGRYLYYVSGAHGGTSGDGAPVVQYDVKTRQKKVIAFLHPFVRDEFGSSLSGTFATAVDPAGDKVYIAWSARGGCVVTVVHIPASERAG